jgi:hypothetical protein
MVKVIMLDGTTRIVNAEEARTLFHRGYYDWDMENECYKQARPRKPRPPGSTYTIRRTRA